MRKSAKSGDGKKAAGKGQPWLRLPGLLHEALYETAIGAGLACVDKALEAERVALCGSATGTYPNARRCVPDGWQFFSAGWAPSGGESAASAQPRGGTNSVCRAGKRGARAIR